MPDILKRTPWFLIPLTILLLIVLPFLFNHSKEDIHIYLNQINSPFADTVFKYITHLGHGTVPLVAGFIALFFSVRFCFIIAGSGLLAGLVAQLLKRLIFSDILRPSMAFNNIESLHIIRGVELHSYFSFPSGHSATIFALCFCIAFFTQRRLLKFILFILAVVIAYSRVYLSQHFFN